MMRAPSSISRLGSALLAFATIASASATAAGAESAATPASTTVPSKRPTSSPPAAAPAGAARPTVAAATSIPPATTRPAAAPPPSVAPPSVAAPRTVAATSSSSSALREPAPRPVTDVRVQTRFATKMKNTQLFGGAEYLSRGDYYNSPGVRVGATYYPYESLGLELQVSHYWSSLNASAERVKELTGYIPDSHGPAWLFLAGGRYSLGYGKLMVGGMGSAIHFEPQGFVHAGMHVADGDIGPSGDFGLGLLVFLTPKMFARIDAAIVYEREDRSGNPVGVWGTLPSLSVGGTL
jgi:hypothetical protein